MSRDPSWTTLRPLWVRAPRAHLLSPLQRTGSMPYAVSIALSRTVTFAEAELLGEYGYTAEGRTLRIPQTTLTEIHANQAELVRVLDSVARRAVGYARSIERLQVALDDQAASITFGQDPGSAAVRRAQRAELDCTPRVTVRYEACGHRLGECICEPQPPTSPGPAVVEQRR